MRFTNHEVDIIRATLPLIKEYPVMQHILKGDLSCQDTNKDSMNFYHKEAVLNALIMGYAQLFFNGNSYDFGLGTDIDGAKRFAEFLKPYFENRFTNHFLEEITKDAIDYSNVVYTTKII